MYQADLKHPTTALQNKLQQLYALNRGAKLEQAFRPQYLDLLHKLGNPHLNLPPTIHVAGTNGKGSVIAMLRSIYEAAGLNVHAYTSPHLAQFNERIVLAGEEITDAHLEALIDEALAVHDNRPISFFEITTAIAFKAFADTPADILLLETGLGGRLDCTNVIENPALTILTNVGLDHQEFLGDTLASIAREKAGICKASAPCVISPQPELRTATANHVPVYEAPITQRYDIALRGDHQQRNAALAVKAVETLQDQFPVPEEPINQGLHNAHWPARLQNITSDMNAPEGWQIWLDGGHNPQAAQAIVDWINAQDHKPHILLGMMPHKDSADFTDIIKPHAHTLTRVNITGESEGLTDWQNALKTLMKDHEGGIILICGSLYLAGEVLAHTRLTR